MVFLIHTELRCTVNRTSDLHFQHLKSFRNIFPQFKAKLMSTRSSVQLATLWHVTILKRNNTQTRTLSLSLSLSLTHTYTHTHTHTHTIELNKTLLNNHICFNLMSSFKEVRRKTVLCLHVVVSSRGQSGKYLGTGRTHYFS